jgi:hypothetical protein
MPSQENPSDPERLSSVLVKCEICRRIMLRDIGTSWCLPCSHDAAKRDIAFLLGLVLWDEEVPEGLDPTMYGTGSYQGDVEIKQRVDKIRETWFR